MVALQLWRPGSRRQTNHDKIKFAKRLNYGKGALSQEIFFFWLQVLKSILI